MLKSKDEIRKKIWNLLSEKGVARFPTPVHGRIPNFEGSGKAAARILDLKQFIYADVVKVNPDYPQIIARKGILEAGARAQSEKI